MYSGTEWQRKKWICIQYSWIGSLLPRRILAFFMHIWIPTSHFAFHSHTHIKYTAGALFSTKEYESPLNTSYYIQVLNITNKRTYFLCFTEPWSEKGRIQDSNVSRWPRRPVEPQPLLKTVCPEGLGKIFSLCTQHRSGHTSSLVSGFGVLTSRRTVKSWGKSRQGQKRLVKKRTGAQVLQGAAAGAEVV